MIIRSLRATNVLKYAELALADLPAAGLIAISGPNESGKSTLGETLCFALFGRTFSLGPDDLQKVIRWGASECSAILDFDVDGRSYELSRFLDCDGNHGARLSKSGDTEPLVRGVEGVADRLFEILGYGFSEFIESFYLAQREITTPHPHSQAVKIMAGVAPMEQVGKDFATEIVDFQEKLGELQVEVDAAEQELADLDLEEGHLVGLEDERTALDHRFHDNQRLEQDLVDALAGCVERLAAIRGAEAARARAATLRGLLLFLTLISAGVWALLTFGAELQPARQLQELLRGVVPEWRDAQVDLVGYAALVFLVLAGLFWSRAASRRRSAEVLRGQSGELAEVLGRVRSVEEVPPVSAPEVATAQESDMPPTLRRVRPDEAQFEAMLQRVARAEASADVAEDYVRLEREWLQDLIERQSVRVAELDQEVDDEMARVQQAARLHEVLAALGANRRQLEERIAQRRLAIELLQGASRQLSRHFNRDVRESVGRMLPLFTAGRYEHLQIDEDLNVRVFSGEKRDFMDLEEVSSGTQRQIMLALRLALSERLLTRAVRGRQFAFLDEPFAFFDAGRTRTALEALADFSDAVTQVWVVAQSFPDGVEVPFALSILCDREQDTLRIGG